MADKPIQVLIVDDEPICLEQSRQKIALYVGEEHICTAQNAVEVMEILRNTAVDLAFVDVEMPDTDGFSIIEYLRSTQPGAKSVFLTGHTELGAKSYDYEPLDFLCKPLDALRLKKTFERFERSRSPGRQSREQVALEGASGFVLVSPCDILYIAREGRKAVIHCKTENHMVPYALDELETIFSDFGLFRIHQSYLVPLERIGRVMRSEFGKTYSATLTDGTQVPVSRGKYGALREHLAAEGIQFV